MLTCECAQVQWATEIGVTHAGVANFTALVKIVNGSRVPVSFVCVVSSASASGVLELHVCFEV